MSRSYKVILWTLGVFIVLIFLCASSLPYLISTTWGTKNATKWFNYFSEGTLSIDDLQLSWWGKQHIENFIYKNEKDETVLRIKTLDTRTTLFYLFFGGRRFGATVIEEPHLVLESTEKKTKEKKERKRRFRARSYRRWPTFSETLSVTDGSLLLKSPHTAPILIKNIDINKQITPSIYQIRALTEQEDITGEIEISITALKKMQVEGKINNFPIAILDQLDSSTLFTDALGNTLNLVFHLAKEQGETTTLSVKIDAKNLNGTIEGHTDGKILRLSDSSQLNFTITPQFFRYLLPKSQKDQWTLFGPTQASLHLTKGIFPFSSKKPDFRDITFQAHLSVDRAEINHTTLGSYSLNQFKADILSSTQLEILYEGNIQGRETSDLSGSIAITPEGSISFRSHYKGFPVTLVSLVSPPLENTIRRFLGPVFDLTTEGIYEEEELRTHFNLAAPNLQVNGEVTGGFDNLQFTLHGHKTLVGKRAQLLGDTINFQFDGVAEALRDNASLPSFNGTLSSPYYSMDVTGKADQLNLHAMELRATGQILGLPFSHELPQVTLRKGEFSIHVDGAKNQLTGQGFLNTQVKTANNGTMNSKKLEANFEITHYIQEDTLAFPMADYAFSCDCEGLPLAMLNPFVPGKIDLPSLFGTLADIEAKGRYTPTQDPRGMLDLKATGEGLDASFSIAIDGTLSVTQNQPAYIHWEMSPQRYRYIVTSLRPDQSPAFQLTQSASIDLSIKELTCPTTLPEDVSHFLCQSGFIGDLTIGTLMLQSVSTHEYLVINHAAGSIEGVNFTEAIDLYFGGRISAHNIPQSEKSAFGFKGSMHNFWTPDGRFNREGLTVDGELSVEFLPVRQITEIFLLDQETRTLLQAVLGELVNARIYGTVSQLSGPLTVDIKASNFKAILPIMLYPHAIHLRDYVEAEITLTPEVNQTLIKDIAPLLIAGAYSDHPIKLYLDPQGFVIPIRPYSFQGIQIQRAIIDIGRIWVRNGGQIQLLMNFLKAKDVTPEGEMNAWFTPIYMNLHNGVATYSRFDALLANTVHIALWGSINLMNNQVDMTLGIAPSTLAQRFNIREVSGGMFQVKMRGTTDNLDLDWSAASTRIGILIARTTAGHIGAIVGGLLEQIIKIFGEEPTPPPTTTPFPWESS